MPGKNTISRIFTTALIIAAASAAFSGTRQVQNSEQPYGFDEMKIIKLDWGLSNLITSDINGDGLKDILAVNNKRARIEALIQENDHSPENKLLTIETEETDINDLAAGMPGGFRSETIAVSQKIFSLVSGDFNSDSMTDLAFYGEPRGLYIMTQKAPDETASEKDGILWHKIKKIDIDDGQPISNGLISDDINNDSRDDLILAGSRSIYVICQKDGAPAPPVKYPTGSQLLGIRTGDLNGDGIKDLLIICSDNEKPVYARFGTENGQLGPEMHFSIDKPWALHTKNIDSSREEEILTIDSVSGRFSCYKLEKDRQKDPEWPILYYPVESAASDRTRDLLTTDINSDGYEDIVISNPASAEIIFYAQRPGLGLARPVRFPAFSAVKSLSAAPVMHKDKNVPQIAMLSTKEKVIGLCRFENERITFPEAIQITGEPVGMQLADIDSSGSTDCIYIAKDVNDTKFMRIIYDLNSSQESRAGTGKPSKGFLFGLDSGADKKTTLHSDLILPGLNTDPEGIKVLDIDQDGMLDIIIFISYQPPIIIRQKDKYVFEQVDPAASHASLIKDASAYSVSTADIDGKSGLEILLAYKNFARSLVFNEANQWNIIDQYNARYTENNIFTVAAFNIADEEKSPDIFLLDGSRGQLQILKAARDRTYRFSRELSVGTWNPAPKLKMLYAPLTGNDTRSILLFDSEKFAIITPPDENNPPAHLERLFNYEVQIKDGAFGNMAVGDINSDGKTDVIMVEFVNNHIEILTFDSELKPLASMRFKIFQEKSYREADGKNRSRVEPRELEIADVTGDGKNDLVTLIHDRIIIYPQD